MKEAITFIDRKLYGNDQIQYGHCRISCRLIECRMFDLEFGSKTVILQVKLQAAPDVLPGFSRTWYTTQKIKLPQIRDSSKRLINQVFR